MGEWLSLEDTKHAFREWQAEEKRRRGLESRSTQFSTQGRAPEPTLPIPPGNAEREARFASNSNPETSLAFYDLVEDRYFSERDIWEDMVRRWKESRIKELAKDIVDAMTTDPDLSKTLDAKIDEARKRAEEKGEGEDTLEIDWDA